MSDKSYKEFREKIDDVTVDDDDLAKYFVALDDEGDLDSIGPLVVIDERIVDLQSEDIILTQGAGLFQLVNSLARRRRYKKFEKSLKEHGDRPVLVTEGDSWFQFPFILKDVVDNLTEQFSVYSVGAAGDTTRNMVFNNPEYLTAIDKAKAISGKKPDGFVFSSGGNDILGRKDGAQVLRKIIRQHQAGETISLDSVYNQEELKLALNELQRAYETLLSEIGRRYPSMPVFVHCYDRVWPFNPSDKSDTRTGKWIQPPLSRRGIESFDDQRMITDDLIKKFKHILDTVDKQHSNLHIIDTSGSLSNRLDLWRDEIHPNADGFKLVSDRFIERINSVLVSLA